VKNLLNGKSIELRSHLVYWANMQYRNIKQYRITFAIKQLYRNYFRGNTSNCAKNTVCSAVERTSRLIKRDFNREDCRITIWTPRYQSSSDHCTDIQFSVTILVQLTTAREPMRRQVFFAVIELSRLMLESMTKEMSACFIHFFHRVWFLRATAVPPGIAEARISYGNSVCLSVCHDPVRIQCQVR